MYVLYDYMDRLGLRIQRSPICLGNDSRGTWRHELDFHNFLYLQRGTGVWHTDLGIIVGAGRVTDIVPRNSWFT